MRRPTLFVELCAGLASVSLRLIGGECRPPVSRMGNKAGYSQAILAALGLRSGQGADALLLCEPDAGCRALLQAYGQPEVLRDAAEVIRGWSSESPKELWLRLRAEGPVKGADGREVARWCAIVSGNRLVNFDPIDWLNTGNGGSRHGGDDFSTPLARVEAALASLPTLPPTVVGADAREVDPREVARWVLLGWQSYKQGQPDSGFRATAGGSWPDSPPEGETVADRLASLPTLPPTVVGADAREVDPREVARWCLMRGWGVKGSDDFFRGPYGISSGKHSRRALTIDGLSARLASLPTLPPTVVGADAREVDPPPRLEGVYCYVDPPYVNTTGYGADLSRAEVVDLARRWSDAGAVVAISEQEAAEGWADDLWSIDITDTRKGQKRTFSKQQREILTLNRKPVQAPAEQLGMFAEGVE